MVVVPTIRWSGAALLSVLLLGPAAVLGQSAPKSGPARASNLAATARPDSAAYGRIPLSFEANRGQAPSDVRFVAHGRGYSIGLTPSEARFSLRRPAAAHSPTGPAAQNLRMRLVGARDSAVVGRELLPGVANYFIGADPHDWRTAVPTYAKVAYTGVYPGIDLLYYGNQSQLEYDFVVAPRSDPSRIALRFDGATKVSVTKAGDLLVGLKGGSVRWNRPVAYQRVGAHRKPVASRFVLRGANQVGFALARYDTAQPLVIDPVLIYATYLGGNGNDQAYGIAVDSSGSAYIAGKTTSQNFPGTMGGFPGSSTGFVAKLNPTGTALVYATFLGGNGDTNIWGIAIDGTGSAYVAGDTTATNFPTVRGFQSSSTSGVDAVVAKLNPAGNALAYSTYLGGSGTDTAQGIALGSGTSAYVTGYTDSTDFPAVNAMQGQNNGGTDAFVAVVNTSGTGVSSLTYSTFLGGVDNERAFGIAVDSGGRFYITGDTASADFPTVNAYQAAILSAQNAFVSAFSADGTTLTYSTFLGGSGNDSGFGITVDKNSNVYVTGQTESADFPKRTPVQATIGGGSDAFVTKLNCAANGDASLVYSTYLGGSANDAGRSITIDVWGNAYVTGDTDSAFTPFTGSKGFVSKLNANGSKLLFGTLTGGSTFESNLGIAIDSAGTAYVTGYTSSTDFPFTPGAFQTSLAGDVNAFVMKMPTFTKVDLNHDNQSDFIFQNTSGSLAYWTMNGDRESKIGLLSPSNPGTGWKLVASADLNGDNDTDLLFQNSTSGDIAVWFMNGTTESSISLLTPRNPGSGWQLVGSGDFNRDGYTDLLFQNSNTGDLFVWNLQGTTMTSGSFISPRNPGAGWKVAAVGDLNGDGQPDIVFQNTGTGQLYAWYLHGTTMFAGGFLSPSSPGTGWAAVGLADLNGDGIMDILFQNTGSGQLAYWIMDGAGSQVYIGVPRPSNPGSGWRLAGH